ncbi:MAG: LPS export ABC transporter ATP-binding protein [Desulfohalobiaceae bacterium]|nr:LPS export ABC transporter ATP-binding protein [Desulfohalobiaceae bacterium]
MSQVTAQNLSKHFGTKVVVNDVGLNLKQGEVVGLLGPNGAGKTTTFYMLVGIIKPNRGRIFVDQIEISDWPLHNRARFGLSYLPQESSVFKKLTVRQNIEIIIEYTRIARKEKQKKTRNLLRELGIAKLEDQKAVLLSGGERRRLEIARSLIQDPKFILLDEPFAGIDPLAVVDIQGIVNGLKEKGIGVLISDHNVRETMQICDRVYLVFEGRIILEGTPEEIVCDSRARQCYLGEGFTL